VLALVPEPARGVAARNPKRQAKSRKRRAGTARR
jgi:hypothetical protein